MFASCSQPTLAPNSLSQKQASSGAAAAAAEKMDTCGVCALNQQQQPLGQRGQFSCARRASQHCFRHLLALLSPPSVSRWQRTIESSHIMLLLLLLLNLMKYGARFDAHRAKKRSGQSQERFNRSNTTLCFARLLAFAS